MKKNIFIVISSICLLLSVGSCSKRSGETPSEPVPIRLYTGIRTRALVDAFSGTPVGIACGTVSGDYTTYWEGTATAGEISLTPVRYYPDDGSPLYLRGYYPLVPVTANGTLVYALTGDEDLMLSDEQNGSLTSPFTPQSGKDLMYSHLLMKLSFTIHVEGDDLSSIRVRSLQLNGLANQVTLTLSTGALACSESTGFVTVYAATDDSEGLPFVDGVLHLPGYALVQPQSDFTLDMVLSIDADRSHDLVYHDLAISFEGGGGEGGTAYTVKVELPTPTFPDPVPVRVTAAIVPWEAGNPGSGNIPGWE